MHTIQEVRRGTKLHRVPLLGLARLFFACADPARIRILLFLRDAREACVSDIADELDMSVAATSHHLQILQQCRCLKTIRMGKMICYRFVANPFTEFLVTVIKNRS